MKLIPELLSTTIFNAILNAHGLYNTEQFVLRLSPKNHDLIDKISEKDFDHRKVDDSTVQAYSTYLHETIHWWQHVGSTAGFIMSLCYPLQTHSNIVHIKEWCELGPAKKSIKNAAMEGELSGKKHLDARQALANTIVNNTMDFEFFKRWLLNPEKAIDIYNDPYFESQGHCFHVVYSSLLNNISDLIDPGSNFIKSYKSWEAKFTKLASEEVTGYYYGSPLMRRRIGVVEIFEGQACFSQMQFLANVREAGCDFDDFKALGILHGVYEKAFNEFINLSKLDYPETVLDPVVALFLLVCDLAINPVEGFPCDIQDFPSFVNDADPGIRFELLSRSVETLGDGISTAIKQYSREEYMKISSSLLDVAGLQQISEGWNVIENWLNRSHELNTLMAEHKSFQFDRENMVLRVLLSSFISFTLDKREHPEFFCWPGHWKSNRNEEDQIESLWLRNLSLFSDKENDDGIFIRQFPGKASEDLKNTLDNFFGNNLIYDLSRQWVLKEGEFSFDFRWLSENIDESTWKIWGDKVFDKQYGVSISNIVT